MAFISILIIFIIAICAILAFLFVVGFMFLSIGIVNKRKIKYKGKKSPIICIIIGSLFLVLPVAAAVIVVICILISSVSNMIKRIDYENITDKWRNEWVSVSDAADDAIKELLAAADSGNREQFKKTFTKNIQRSEGFDTEMNIFLNHILLDCRNVN